MFMFNFMYKPGIVNVKMVLTEEKILSNIDRVQKIINPNSKKQIIQLDEDANFKDLIESIKTYLVDYPKKKNFPVSVYRAAYDLIEYATNQFEDNTKQIEELIRQREKNIGLASTLKNVLTKVENKEKDWKAEVKAISNDFSEDIIAKLESIAKCKDRETEDYENDVKEINARVNNLESNLHIEIDMERIEDRSKALSYIGIEIADALKLIPTPVEELMKNEQVSEAEVQAIETVVEPEVAAVAETKTEKKKLKNKVQTIKAVSVEEAQEAEPVQDEQYYADTRIDIKPTLWQKLKQSKVGRAIRYIFKIRISIQLPEALPEGNQNR